jgi:hypothetical protein
VAVWARLRDVYGRTAAALEEALIELARAKREQGRVSDGTDPAAAAVAGGPVAEVRRAATMMEFAPTRSRFM